MCGRFYVPTEREDQNEFLHAIISDAQQRTRENIAVGEVFPGSTIAVVANDINLKSKAFGMQWGLPKTHNRRGLLFNARCETADTLLTFSESSVQRRCIIPASVYFEWEQTQHGKLRYALRPKDQEFTALAGLYVLDSQTRRAYCAIITRPASWEIAFIHDRMPLILPCDKAEEWLSPSNNYRELLKYAIDDVEFMPA